MVKKELNSFRYSLIVAGQFLGAGFLSGRELWQYFSSFGKNGILGLLVAMLLLFSLGTISVYVAKREHVLVGDDIFLPWNTKFLHAIITFLQVFTLFVIVAGMIAGIASLLEQLFGISYVFCCVLFSVLMLLVSLAGLNGVSTVFSITVPLLIGFTIAFGVLAIFRQPEEQLAVERGRTLIANHWLASAITFVSYNEFGAIIRSFYFGKELKSNKKVVLGNALGVGALLLISLCDYIALTKFGSSANYDLPMLYIAGQYGGITQYIYAVLLIVGMFGTGLSAQVGCVQFFSNKISWIHQNEKLFTVGLSALIFAASLIGFADFVGRVYPLIGYASMVFLTMMIYKFLILRKKSEL